MNNKALNVWTDINGLLRTHKLINGGLLLVCLFQVFVIGLMYCADPIVVVSEKEEHRFYVGKREDFTFSEKVVENFVMDFLKIRYQWKKLDPNILQKNLAPLTTEGLNKKIGIFLKTLQQKEFQGKRTSQAIVNMEVSVTKEKVVASFDKLLKIEGIPVPIPTTVSLHIIRGTSNVWNPTGLLVNGIREHQTK